MVLPNASRRFGGPQIGHGRSWRSRSRSLLHYYRLYWKLAHAVAPPAGLPPPSRRTHLLQAHSHSWTKPIQPYPVEISRPNSERDLIDCHFLNVEYRLLHNSTWRSPTVATSFSSNRAYVRACSSPWCTKKRR